MLVGTRALVVGLVVASLAGGCRSPEARGPTDAPHPDVRVETDASTEPVEAVAPAPIGSLDDLAYAASEGFAGRVDARGVVFLDIYDDESEESKPIQAARVCGEQLDEHRAMWARDLGGRFGDAQLDDFPDYLRCDGETCWHEAFEAGGHRGSYRFEAGILREVAWTSGPPAHIMESALDAEDRFAEEAFEALRDQPCGAVYEGELRFDESAE